MVLVAAPILARSKRTAVPDPAFTQVLERFLSRSDPVPAYRALRRLEARNDQRTVTAWMDAWTEADGSGGFTYGVVAQGGSTLIQSKVFLASLEAEKRLARAETPGPAALTPQNYIFEPGDLAGDLSALDVTPRRKDVLLIDGSIFLKPETGELVRLEGRLSKAPSFWVRDVDVVRRYERIGGVGLPISLDAVARVRLAGRNTFRMTYQYETVNGQRVGSPDAGTAP
jgi:hypothetical protein